MQFISFGFLLMLPPVALIYYLIPQRFRYVWLFAVSMLFYAGIDIKALPVLIFTALFTYISGRFIGNASKKEGRAALFLTIAVNLVILVFCKYTFLSFPGAVGVSFYMLMAISYLIDVYRGDIACEKNIIRYALFVSFFPYVTSGPIERAGNMLPQFEKPSSFDGEKIRDGLLLMLWGYFMKLVIADRCAILVGNAYASPEKYAGMATLAASILYSFEIYCDFAGYSNIAIGCAKVMGIELMDNFRSPYLADSLSDFWHRWHISLSGWFRDYVYIPLGGNRKGNIRKYINILIVFILSGMWHGAGISFAVWGLLHGIYQVVGYITKPLRDRLCSILSIDRKSFSHRLLKILVTFMLVDIAWVFFRVTDIGTAVYMVRHMFDLSPDFIAAGGLLSLGIDGPSATLLLLSIALLIAVDIAGYRGICIRQKLAQQGIVLRWLVYIAAVILVLVCGIWGPGYDEAGFIYAQF